MSSPTSHQLAKAFGIATATLAAVVAPWAALGGIPMLPGNVTSIEAPVTPWIPVTLLVGIAISFAVTVWDGSRRSWVWLVPFALLTSVAPVGASLLFMVPLVVGLVGAVLVALPPAAVDESGAA